MLLVCVFAPLATPQSPDELWVARYGGPDGREDYGEAIAVDADGNVYVAGAKGKAVGNYLTTDYLTVKYDSDGNELWVAEYNGPGNGYDFAVALALDAAGNVYVTGYSIGSGVYYNYDYATIKYDSDGNELWVARYDGPGNNIEYAKSVALDAAGNVYVTGTSTGASGTNKSAYDYATVKYDPDGNKLWVARYDGTGHSTDYAEALAVDADGSVYVTGRSTGSGGDYDYATIKYSDDGQELWVTRYNGSADSGDHGTAMGLDDYGNVYVTGASTGVGTHYDYVTVSYNSEGSLRWESRYNGPASDRDYPNALTLDASGNVYVTGYSTGSDTSTDYATVKYAPDGSESWVARYNGPNDDPYTSRDMANAIEVDVFGNVYVTGSSRGITTYDDYATVGYAPDGSEKWVARYSGTADLRGDYPSALALDENGNTYVTGHAVHSGADLDVTTIKYENTRGLVNGFGWIDSEPGAYPPDPAAQGKAAFGFLARFENGADVPTGNVTFVFNAGSLRFQSSSFDWLVVNGSGYARLTGSGILNGGGDYRFSIWAGDSTASGGEDTFRMKIWWEDEGAEVVVYDNGLDQPLARGNILVNKSK